jgi:hypothetical protein
MKKFFFSRPHFVIIAWEVKMKRNMMIIAGLTLLTNLVLAQLPIPDTIWTNIWGRMDGTDAYNAIVQTNDDGFVMAGETYSYGAGVNDGLLQKINSSGHLIWMHTFGGSASDI